MDVNATPGSGNDCDPDTSGQGDLGDRRYAYAQDRNWNVVALLETDDGVGTAGRAAERYAYTPYGEFSVLRSQGGVQLTPATGNTFAHQGLFLDHETGRYQNRSRIYDPGLERFILPDPAQYLDGMNLFCYLKNAPTTKFDPLGLADPCPGGGMSGNCSTTCSNACKCLQNQICSGSPTPGAAVMCMPDDCRCACLCNKGSPSGGSPQQTAIRRCMLAHEEYHVMSPRASCDCSPKPCPQTVHVSEQRDEECYAYARDINCLAEEKGNCNGDPTCINAINARIAACAGQCASLGGAVYPLPPAGYGAHWAPGTSLVPWGPGSGPCP
jgi:RHS repeat-associated protein